MRRLTPVKPPWAPARAAARRVNKAPLAPPAALSR